MPCGLLALPGKGQGRLRRRKVSETETNVSLHSSGSGTMGISFPPAGPQLITRNFQRHRVSRDPSLTASGMKTTFSFLDKY